MKIINKKQQQGIALIATLLMIVIFTFVGMNIATKGKKNQEMTGANARNNIVFEASEMSLRKAIRFIRAIRNGEPNASENASLSANANIKALVENFDVTKAQDNSVSFVTDPSYSFIWEPGAVRKACGNKCPDGLDYTNQIDNKELWNKAIKSTFKDDDDFENNYLSDVETRTFIELLRDASVNTEAYSQDGNFIGGAGKGYYYLITVKGSGFPPGADKENSLARENVVLQTVYAQKY